MRGGVCRLERERGQGEEKSLESEEVCDLCTKERNVRIYSEKISKGEERRKRYEKEGIERGGGGGVVVKGACEHEWRW